jgi:hypothetical protein
VKGWAPIPPWRDESLIDNGVHQKVRKLQTKIRGKGGRSSVVVEEGQKDLA